MRSLRSLWAAVPCQELSLGSMSMAGDTWPDPKVIVFQSVNPIWVGAPDTMFRDGWLGMAVRSPEEEPRDLVRNWTPVCF